MRRLFFILPMVLLVAMLGTVEDSVDTESRPDAEHAHISAPDEGRLVVLIIDSLRRATLEADGVMPELLGLVEDQELAVVDVTTCAANFTYPCLQTLFEGRQSPFVAGLHNFTGRASDGRSVPADLEARGRRTAVISNISLVSLYGHHAAQTVNVEAWPISHLERDLKTVDVALEWVGDDELDDLLVHLLGTDKAAHHERPGSEGYQTHFQKVDARSAKLVTSLDLSRDHLIITGDHGHDEQGHHTSDSIALLAGPRWGPLIENLDRFEGLDQTELVYFMSLATGLALPPHYEGRYFATEYDVDPYQHPALTEFVETTRSQLEAAGYDADDMEAAIAAHRADAADEHGQNLFRYLPLLALFFLWLAVIHTHLRGHRRAGPRWAIHGALAVGCVLTWQVASPSLVVSLGLSALYLSAAALWCRRTDQIRYALWAGVILAVTALIGLNVRQWADFFHTRGGFVPGQPIFYTLLPLAGLVLSWIRWGRWQRAAEGAMAFCLFCLPSGVYYYQFGQNMFWGFLLASALVLVVVYGRQIRRDMRCWVARWRPALGMVAAVLVGSMILLLMQESGGWEWHYFPVDWLRDAGSPWAVGLYAGLIGYLVSLLKGWSKRLLMVGYMGASAAFAIGVGAMPLVEFVAAHTVVAFMASWLFLGRTPLRVVTASEPGQRSGLVLWGALLAMAWFLVGGFFIHNIDFHFAFDYFGDLQHDRHIFIGVFGATVLKYGFPLGSLLLFFRLLRGASEFSRAMDWTVFFSAFMILAIFTQILFAAVGSTEKLYELAVAQLVFVFVVLVITFGFSAVVGGIDWARKSLMRQKMTQNTQAKP